MLKRFERTEHLNGLAAASEGAVRKYTASMSKRETLLSHDINGKENSIPKYMQAAECVTKQLVSCFSRAGGKGSPKQGSACLSSQDVSFQKRLDRKGPLSTDIFKTCNVLSRKLLNCMSQ